MGVVGSSVECCGGGQPVVGSSVGSAGGLSFALAFECVQRHLADGIDVIEGVCVKSCCVCSTSALMRQILSANGEVRCRRIGSCMQVYGFVNRVELLTGMIDGTSHTELGGHNSIYMPRGKVLSPLPEGALHCNRKLKVTDQSLEYIINN